jgi:uncharacterized protein (DUF2141 family)
MNLFQQLTLGSILALSATAFTQAAEIQLTVSNIQVAKGSIQIAIFNSEETYNNGEAVVTKSIKVTADKLDVSFPNLIDGEYAIKLLHDENDNGRLDTNLVGMPTEGYGFSNNAGRFGPASYADANFAVVGDTPITINIR